MPDDVTEQLRRYGEAVEQVATAGSGEPEELGKQPRTRRRRWPAAAAAVLLVGIAAALVVSWSDDSGDAGVVVDTAGESGGSLFGSPTDAVLVFSDGYDGVLALDVDAGVAARRVLEGERAGDQPFRLTVVDNELVVGWGEIHAVPLDGSDPHLVTEATTYVPAAEPGEIWAFDYSGGRVGAGDLTLRRVDLNGNVTFSTEDFDTNQGWPLLGVPGGLAVATDSGIAVWDAATGRTGETLGSERPAAAASDGSRLAWCEQRCATVRTVELAQRGPATPQHRSTDQAPRFSPDGQQLAFAVEEANGTAVKVRDLDTGTDTVVADAMSGPVALQWDPRGHQLFFTETQDGTITRVGRYDLDSGTTAVAEVSLQGQLTTGSFIVLPRTDAEVLLSDELTRSGACAPPTVFPSGREGICAFPVESRPPTSAPTMVIVDGVLVRGSEATVEFTGPAEMAGEQVTLTVETPEPLRGRAGYGEAGTGTVSDDGTLQATITVPNTLSGEDDIIPLEPGEEYRLVIRSSRDAELSHTLPFIPVAAEQGSTYSVVAYPGSVECGAPPVVIFFDGKIWSPTTTQSLEVPDAGLAGRLALETSTSGTFTSDSREPIAVETTPGFAC